MEKSECRMLTNDQIARLQQSYLSATFAGSEPTITDKTLESDGRKRNRIVKDAVDGGLLLATDEKSSYGVVLRITPEVLSSVEPVDFSLFELWGDLQEKNPHREAYERPWIRVEGLSVENQCSLLRRNDIDWFVVSRAPYEYLGSFADAPETILTDARRSEAHNRYWAGPFSMIAHAIERRKTILDATIAVSSKELRQIVADFYAEQKIQRAFANNLLWGLVDVANVPNDLLFNSDGKPTLDTQLDEGHSLRFASNPSQPSSRQEVTWESNLAKSIERLKSRITNAEEQLERLRLIESRIQSTGGWCAFMDAMEQRLRTELSKEPDIKKST
ncbi:MAG: hypothetical protein WCH39_17595 [Schlesneria sp.]